MGAPLKIGITLAHQKCSGWASRLSHSSRTVMRNHSLGWNQTHTEQNKVKDATVPTGSSFMGLHCDVSKFDSLAPHADVKPHQRDYWAARSLKKTCITRIPAYTRRVNIKICWTATKKFEINLFNYASQWPTFWGFASTPRELESLCCIMFKRRWRDQMKCGLNQFHQKNN